MKEKTRFYFIIVAVFVWFIAATSWLRAYLDEHNDIHVTVQIADGQGSVVEYVMVGDTPVQPGVYHLLDKFPTLDMGTKWSSGRHLVISYYNNAYSANRLGEIRDTIRANIANQFLDKIHILMEHELPEEFLAELSTEEAAKLVLVELTPGQPTYAHLFAYANLVFLRGTVAIISNSDIEIGETIECANGVTPANKVVYNQTERRLILALSRHASECGKRKAPLEHNECLKYRGSHDTFVFAPPLSEHFIEQVQFKQNMLGAENRLIFEMRNHSYRVSNPCTLIRVRHHHCTRNSRNIPSVRFAKKGDGNYASVDPIARYSCGNVIY